MRQESQISLICPRCYTRSEAIITSDGGVVTIAFNSDHVSVNHAVTKGTLVPDPHCKHCPNPIFDHGVRFDDAYMIMCDARLGPAIQKFNHMGVYTQWSCQGHFRVAKIREDGNAFIPDFSVPYLLFCPDQPEITKRLYRCAMRLDEEKCITPELSYYNYGTGRRVKFTFSDLTDPGIARNAQFGIDFDSAAWAKPRDQFKDALSKIDANTLQETVTEQMVHRKSILNMYHSDMTKLQDTFIQFVNDLAREYEQAYIKGGKCDD